MNKKLLKLCFFVLLTFLMSHVSWAGFLPVANISRIEGEANLSKDGEKEEIKVGTEIVMGMELNIPKKNHFVEVRFQNGHLVRFTGSKVKIEDLNPKTTLISLLRGKIFSIIKPLTENETFKIKTKRVSFAVRGTKFLIDENKTRSYLCVCEGTVLAKTQNGEIEVKKDEDFNLKNSKDRLKSSPSTKTMTDTTNLTFNEMNP